MLYARATFCQLLKKHSIITDEETLKDNNQTWHNHFSFENIRRGMFDMRWPKQVFNFQMLTFKSTWWDNKFYIGSVQRRKEHQDDYTSFKKWCKKPENCLNFRNKIRKTLPSFFCLTDLSDSFLLYQILALWWLGLKHTYFVLRPYCPLLTIAVAPKFHSGSLLTFVFPSVIHTETLKNILKKQICSVIW